MRRWIILIIILLFVTGISLVGFILYPFHAPSSSDQGQPGSKAVKDSSFSNKIRLINSTYLGNKSRNYYGDSLPAKLEKLFQVRLGGGETYVSKERGLELWSGAGWTDQPLLIEENNKLFLVIGAYDHKLKKIDAETGKIVWEYAFDDVIKGTGSIWHNKNAINKENEFVILQGSRMGVENSMSTPVIPSYRAISLATGKALWKYNIKRTVSYSRDVDGSALILNDTVYLGMENGTFVIFYPEPTNISIRDGILQPCIYKELKLFNDNDWIRHGGNVVIESSPCYLNNHIYITAGSGHVYGYSLKTKNIDWDFFIGADMDGSPAVTADSCLMVTVEKQYINGQGGVFKLDPRRKPEDAVLWYFPTGNKELRDWEGGVIGSVAVSQGTGVPGFPDIAAFSAIDDYLYVVHQNTTVLDKSVEGPDGKTKYPAPQLLFKYRTGPSISTPIIVQNRLLAAGYRGIYLFEFDKYMQFKLLDYQPIGCESTPLAYKGRVYIASRDGNLYCFGK